MMALLCHGWSGGNNPVATQCGVTTHRPAVLYERDSAGLQVMQAHLPWAHQPCRTSSAEPAVQHLAQLLPLAPAAAWGPCAVQEGPARRPRHQDQPQLQLLQGRL